MVTTDTIDGRDGLMSRPRLTIVLERSAELRGFMSRSGFSFLANKQAITAQIWEETSVEHPSVWRSALSLRDPDAGETHSIFVCFAEFEQVAEYAAHKAVKGKDLRTFAASLGLGDRLWRLERSFGPPIVFVHSDEQARALRSTESQAHWADLYYTLVKPHDEFGYLERSEIVIEVDSRETFERDFAGNWYYYFK